jgi:glycosyltransferase involved in cell wall biosynthesis
VVTTDVGDAALVVGDTGVVVPPRNVQALAEGMRQMIDMGEDEYAALSTAVRQRIDAKFSLAQVVHHYGSFLARGDLRASMGQPEFGI